jgi:protein-S-isoprenylcysteine O-methyltransferase Ste14
MSLTMPVSPLQIWAFEGLSLIFFLLLLRALRRRALEKGGKRDRRSSLGILLQTVAIAAVAVGRLNVASPLLSPASLLATAGVVLLMLGATWLFAASSSALGRNWSIIARMRSDHELIRSGPYSRVRHPIYLGLLLFLFAVAIAFGHWLQLILAVPLYLAGTRIRTDVEDRLLEQTFGEDFREYRNSTPALLPRL